MEEYDAAKVDVYLDTPDQPPKLVNHSQPKSLSSPHDRRLQSDVFGSNDGQRHHLVSANYQPAECQLKQRIISLSIEQGP